MFRPRWQSWLWTVGIIVVLGLLTGIIIAANVHSAQNIGHADPVLFVLLLVFMVGGMYVSQDMPQRMYLSYEPKGAILAGIAFGALSVLIFLAIMLL